MSDNLHKDVRTSYCLLPASLPQHTSALTELNGIRLLGQPSMYKHLVNAPQC